MFGKEDSSSHRPRYTSKSASGLMAEWRSARLAFAMAAAFAIALFGMIYLFGPGEHEATPAFAQMHDDVPCDRGCRRKRCPACHVRYRSTHRVTWT